jgi:hypothetical protein
MQRIVISETFGGFGVSDQASRHLRALGAEPGREMARDDPRLVQVVDDLGDDASGRFAHLVVIEIPDDVKWHINEYDGFEILHEDHRSWTSAGAEVNCS